MTPQKSKLIDLRPSKQVYAAASADIGPIGAVKELIDNALDSWRSQGPSRERGHIKVFCEAGETRIIDDAGGLPSKDLQNIYALGETTKRNGHGSVGAYGIGAKKAITRLAELQKAGGQAQIRSRQEGRDRGAGFRLDSSWFKSDEKWTVELENFEGMEPGTTEIVTKSPNEIWSEEALIGKLKHELRRTYTKFLSGDALEGGSLELIVNGERLEPPPSPCWSFTPFDGLHPRTFEGKTISVEGAEDPIEVSVTVGLLREQSDSAGTDVYCQDRLILSGDKGDAGGYGRGDHKIGKWTHHCRRLKVIVELATHGDASMLPWDSEKSTLDTSHPATRSLHRWLRKIVRPYYEASTGRVRKAFVKPYDASSEYAYNGGEIETFDYTGRKRITDQPDRSLQRVTQISNLAKAHAEFGIRCYEGLEPAEIPAYEEILTDAAEDTSELKEVESPPQDLVERWKSGGLSETADVSQLIQKISGLGSSVSASLREGGFDTVGDLASSSVDQLCSVEGIGKKRARRLLTRARQEIEERLSQKQGDIEGSSDPSTSPSDLTHESERNRANGSGSEAVKHAIAELRSSLESQNGSQDGDVAVLPLRLEEVVYRKICKRLGLDPDDPDEVALALAHQVEALYS